MENQKTVTDWCNKYYPNETRQQMLKVLIEEATELSIAMGDISYEEIIEVVSKTWKELSHDKGNSEHIASGVADVQIAIHAIASKVGMQAQEALDEKMAKNRKNIGD